jgi:hypothetical protein
MTKLALLLILAGCSGCPSPVAPPVQDAGLAPSPPSAGTGPCDLACADMAAVGCAEGASAYCPGAMAKVQADRLIVVSQCPPDAGGITCFVSCDWCRTARTPAEVVARCGSSCSASGTGR